MKNLFKYWLLFFLLVIAVSCNVFKKTSTPRNLEGIYNPASSSIHPRIKVYNNSDTSSLIIERVFTKDLLFNQANSDNKLLARIKIVYNLYDLNKKQILADSSTTTFKFEKDPDILFFTTEVPVKAIKGNNYLLEIITTDLNRKNSQYSFLRIDRTRETNLQDFVVYNGPKKEYLINSYINEKKEFGIKFYVEDLDSLNVYFFANNFIIPQAPDFEDTLRDNFENVDTSWICYLDSIKYQNYNREGIYYFTKTGKIYNESSGGLAFFNFGEAFPIVRTPEDLAKPIFYLGTLDSIPYSDSTGKLTKLAVDNFWLGKANNIDKSRELIKAFYNRVMLANKYFTSYKEGWQTDRGMIYIIYGLPDYLYKSGDEERWIYNPTGLGTGVTFIFKYAEHPFSLNHYVLDREKLKFTGWDEAIKMWNNGEIFYFQNTEE
ncbi:GWxTD domain-containing protein [Bacteroidota bacterium]